MGVVQYRCRFVDQSAFSLRTKVLRRDRRDQLPYQKVPVDAVSKIDSKGLSQYLWF
jgi:hypothetical protein